MGRMLPELTSRLEFNTRCPITVAGSPLEPRHCFLCARPATGTHPKAKRTRFSRRADLGILRSPTRMLAFQCSGERAMDGANPAARFYHPLGGLAGLICKVLQGPLRRALFFSLIELIP